MFSYFSALALTIILTAVTSAFSGIVTSWADVWKPILLLIPFYLLSIIAVFLFYFISAIFVKKDGDFVEKPGKFAQAIIRDGSKFITILFRLKFDVTGIENIPSNKKSCVFVMNHRGLIDPFCLSGYLKDRNVAFVCKQSLFKIPLVNHFMFGAGFLALDRQDTKQALRLFLQGKKYLVNGDTNIGIFPEGTRNKDENSNLLPFHPGSLKLAYKAECPIVVMTMNNSNLVWRRAFTFRRTRIYLNFAKTYQFDEFKDRNSVELTDEIHEVMDKSYEERKNLKKY